MMLGKFVLTLWTVCTVRYPLKGSVEIPVPPLRRNTMGDSEYDAVDARMSEWQVGMITPPTGIVIMVITLRLP